ncbi:MAG: cytochrome c oxidase subunit 3 [Proteobacteria bacterium]|nr:cytochrome c oxidase subunit 3 [Pseudomonadota bacterium]
MTFALVFLAVIMATVIGWLLRQTLNTQPWEANDPLENQPGRGVINADPAKIGLISFIAVVTSLFALFLSAYLMRMQLGDWRPLAEPDLLWLNTAILVLASVAFQVARGAASGDQPLTLKVGLVVGGVCTTLFLLGQLAAWQQLNASGYFMTGNPANSFFYLLTALHGLHLLGGMWVWGRTTMRLLTGADAKSVRLSVELCTVYWHYLLLVWIGLFALLLST